jgi:hypothetical protein
VFDRNGALVALVAPHRLIAPEAVRAFLAGGEPTSEGARPLSAGDIAARQRHALVAVFCPK